MREKMDLDVLAKEKGTDKSTVKHGYTLKYQSHFDFFRHDTFTMIEIGVGGGESLRMWEEYFPNANIIGVDILDDARKNETDRISIEVGDQTDPLFLQSLIKKYPNPRIIIDDGGHTMKQQIVSFEALFNKVCPGGWYVIEDLHTSYLDGGVSNRYKGQTTVEYLKELLDTVNFQGKRLNRCLGYKPLMEKELEGKIELSDFEKGIEGLHFYKSIAFISRSRIESH